MLRAKLKESVEQARNSMKGAATMGDNQSTQSLVIEPIPQTTSKGAGLAEIVVFTDGRKEASRILEFRRSACRRESRPSDQRISAARANTYHGSGIRAWQRHTRSDGGPRERNRQDRSAPAGRIRGYCASSRSSVGIGVEIVVSLEQRGGRACVLCRPCGCCAARAASPNPWY